MNFKEYSQYKNHIEDSIKTKRTAVSFYLNHASTIDCLATLSENGSPWLVSTAEKLSELY